MRLNSGSLCIREARQRMVKSSWRYCFEAVQRPTHPSDRLNDPEPRREKHRRRLSKPDYSLASTSLNST
jgi:hypothetical protein